MLFGSFSSDNQTMRPELDNLLTGFHQLNLNVMFDLGGCIFLRMVLTSPHNSSASMPFLDILITCNEDGSLNTTVYRKPTHIDLYLQWNSHHIVSSKYSMIGTLNHRAETICSRPQLLQEEEKYLQKALQKCKYHAWALNKVKIKKNNSANKKRRDTTKTGQNNNNQKPYMVVPTIGAEWEPEEGVQ